MHAWATDYDNDSCETYRTNICLNKPETVICEDIRKLSIEKLRSISEIDAFAFGFPCNDFSVVGEQKGINGTYGPLYEYGVKAKDQLTEEQVKWVLKSEGYSEKEIERAISDYYVQGFSQSNVYEWQNPFSESFPNLVQLVKLCEFIKDFTPAKATIDFLKYKENLCLNIIPGDKNE